MRNNRLIATILSITMVALMTIAAIPILGAIFGIDGKGIISNAAAEAVTVGTYNGSNVTAVTNKGFVVSSYDLSKMSDETTTETIRAAVKFTNPIMDDSYHTIDFDLAVENNRPSDGVFSASIGSFAPPSKTVTFTITYDPRDVSAGTYTVDLKIMLDHPVVANGGALQCEGNTISVPLSVTFTGNNPFFDPAVTTISAEPGNGQNVISWKTVENCDEYAVFRREGKDAKATTPELGEYTYLAAVRTAPDRYTGEDQFTNPIFVDHYALNGTTYSYIVLSGASTDPFHGNPSKSVSAAPRSARRAVPAAPYGISGYSNDGETGIDWLWDAKGGQKDPETDETDNSSGEGYIHHFNVYRNGRLFKQVQQNAAEEREAYGSTYYRWETGVSFVSDNADATFMVTAVDVDGNESVAGEMLVLSPSSDSDLYIRSHEAWCYEEDNKKGLYIELDCSGIERFDIWRKPAASADSSYAKVTLSESDYESGIDYGVEFGKVYTYKAIGHARDGRVTDPYIFTVAADSSDDSYYYVPGGRPLSMRLRTYDGENATIDFACDGEGTYKLYRDGSVIKTWTDVAVNQEVVYTDELTADGNYEYYLTWTSKAYPSLTVKSNTIVFARDTSDVDPDELETVPAAPRLTGRVSGNTVTMSWTAGSGGGPVNGYIIYRTDNGVANTHMWHNTWIHPLQDQAPNGRYISRPSDKTVYDMSIAWKESDYAHVSGSNDFESPHKLWVVAYNDLGMSEPSNILIYNDDNGEPPANVYSENPGAPENVSAWCDVEDREGTLSYLSNKLMISWATPSTGGTVAEYHYVIRGSNGSELAGDKVPGDYSDNTLSFIIGSSDIEPGVEYTITISAVNDKGSASAAPIKITPVSTLAFKAEPKDNTSAKLNWTDLKNDNTTVSEYQIWRRANLSKWEKVKTIDGSATKTCTDTGLEPGTTYEYYVVALDSNGVSHKSVTRDVKTTSRTEVTEAPSNFSARNVKGDVILSWTPPASGGRPVYYVLQYQTLDKDPSNEYDWSSVELKDEYYGNESTTGAFGNSTGAAIMSWQYDDSLPSSRYSDFRNLRGQVLRLRIRPYGYNSGLGPASNITEFTWPDESSIILDSAAPAPIDPEVIPGDGKVTIRWTHKTGANEASFYQLLRTWGGNNRVVFTIPVEAGKTSYEFVDDDTDIENGREYTYELRPCSSYLSHDSYGNKYWYSNLCYMHQVTVVPNGQTTDQKIADNVEALYDSLIDSKPDPLTEEYCMQVRELENNYDSLTKYQKNLLRSEKCAQIEALIAEVDAFMNNEVYGDDPAVAAVKAEIAAIDPEAAVDEAYENQVNTARANYEALPTGAKSLVDNLSRLTAAEAHIKQVKRDIVDQAKADALSAKLEAIDVEAIQAMTADTLTDETEGMIADLRWEYDSLTKAQKAKVSAEGLQKLEDAEAAINDILGIDHVHDMKVIAAVEATCKDKGSIQYYKCKKCGKAFMDESGETEITDMSSVETPADPSKHRWSEWAVEEEPTCTETGTSKRTCEVCGETETRTDKALGHDYQQVEDDADYVEPGCGTAGQRTMRCTRCGDTMIEEIPATGNHTWDGGLVTKQPAIGVNGVRTYTCTVCGAKRNENIAALRQTEIVDLPAVKISKPKAAKKKVTVKWKKVSKKNLKKIQGIEIRVTGPGYNKTFTAGKKKTSKKIKGLASKTKYTVSVRAYKWVGKVKHVSAWKSKTVKVK